MLSALAQARRLAHPLVVLDIGCRWGAPDAWTRQASGAVRVWAFDADADECRRLQAEAPPDVTYVALALADRDGPVTLHVTAEPACSSLFPPDRDALQLFPELRVATPVHRQQLRATTLDGWARDQAVGAADVVKLDVQGSELAVLRGAQQILSTVRIIEVEVTFNPVYTGQPLFGDLDRFLRGRGFRLWRLAHLVHYATGEQPDVSNYRDRQFFDSRIVEFDVQSGQVTWGHAYYCAHDVPRRWASDPAVALRDACAAELVGLIDLAALSARGVLPG